jgi:hypothetical protein
LDLKEIERERERERNEQEHVEYRIMRRFIRAMKPRRMGWAGHL